MTHWASGMRLTPARLGESESGVVNVVITAASAASASVTFGAPFAAVPRIVCQVVTGSGTAVKSTALVTIASATGFTVRVDITTSTTITVPVHWQSEL